MTDRSEEAWYRDAVVYQTHVKAFFDSNHDGVGDFRGLIEKLDYIRELGVTAIWLLPFYPSPLRDDGYDIATYRGVHPSYGTLADARRFVRAAHARGLRIITELVINHTSDQHPWFQRARKAKAGSAARRYYVWSDTDQKYAGTRIIFRDAEKSNWTWDSEAGAYYWHRFYSHQPDLNFDNPRVLREVLNAMHFWLKAGVDGLRLDAVPYLCEREGTSNENLPETHQILKRIRTEVDAHYSDRLLLAEANQWPEDAQEYFGNGDECHMALHFPLMPRMYMAIAQEDRHPITDILRQTPDIPEGCQWAIFLRNHDELTLEMVTDQERDYLWDFYAADGRMRINLGIRRRLAPLMDNDRRKVELMNGLVLSMPGTPILYYGDEIGMGDNVFLGDRDGVRTPMQWSHDRNGGFSRANPERLYLPAIMDPVYGYEAVNVEAQQRDPSSLLNWTRRMIAVRQRHSAFGRGTIEFLYPGNRKILAYLRVQDGETILCVVNLARSAQAVELDLSAFRGRVPLELSGRSRFPPIGDLPYLLTLTGYGFYWFLLEQEAAAPEWHHQTPPSLPEFVTMVLRDGWASAGTGTNARLLAEDALPQFLPHQRWFGGKGGGIRSVRIGATAELPGGQHAYWLVRVEVAGGGRHRRYFLPLAVTYAPDSLAPRAPLLPFTVAKGRQGARTGPVYDALADPGFAAAVVAAMAAGTAIDDSDGEVRFVAGRLLAEAGLSETPTVRSHVGEQTNSTVFLDDRAVLKVYRRLSPGPHPEIEMLRALTELVAFANTPSFLGAVEHISAGGTRTALAILQWFVPSQGNAWASTCGYLRREIDHLLLYPEQAGQRPAALFAANLIQAEALGRRTGELHLALAGIPGRTFRPEPFRPRDMAALRKDLRARARAALAVIRAAGKNLDAVTYQASRKLLGSRARLLTRVDRLCMATPLAARTRLHGDFHLAQTLIVQDDFFILDFEGEPARTIAERRTKDSPLRDVAGMLRSFDYAARLVAWERADADVDAAAGDNAFRLALAWRDAASRAFLAAYARAASRGPGWPQKEAERKRLIALYSLQKALYEVAYEADNRPGWLRIPLFGLLDLLGLGARRDGE